MEIKVSSVFHWALNGETDIAEWLKKVHKDFFSGQLNFEASFVIAEQFEVTWR